MNDASRNLVVICVLFIGIFSLSLIFLDGGLTGMVSENSLYSYSISDFIDISFVGGDGSSSQFNATITPILPGPGIIYFDTFGNCNSCVVSVSNSAYDEDYAGIINNNQTLCIAFKTDGNTPINTSVQLLSLLPSGFDGVWMTSRSFHNESTPGTTRYALNDNATGFDTANAIELKAGAQLFLSNWSDGSSFGGGRIEDFSCRIGFDPYATTPGEYTIPFLFVAQN